MSLKAKLEAVIYAAEEPVTLTQLAALFAADALEWKAEEEAASAERATSECGATQPTEPLLPPLVPEEFAGPEPDRAPDGVEDAAAPPESSAEPPSEPAPDASPEAGAEPVEASADAELESRRLARLREREVRGVIRQLLDELIASHASDGRGVEIREIAGGFRMGTKPECHDAVRSFVKSLKPALKLSLPALETLAVIAYKQPVTAPEVNEIRGVDSSGVFGSLLARKLIATAGRKQVIGRPILYKTTREFLLRFGLKDVTELPSMEEFEKLAELELDEPEPAAEAEPANTEAEDLSMELNESDDEALSGGYPSTLTEPEEPTAESKPIHVAEPAAADAPELSQELDESDDEYLPGEYPSTLPEATESIQTAATAVSNESLTPAEAASAETVSTEQAETENSPNGEEDHKD
jgi:segregation and condensation protein B